MITLIVKWKYTKRVELKCSHQKKKDKYGGFRCVNSLDGRNPFTKYMWQIIGMYISNSLQFYLLIIPQ